MHEHFQLHTRHLLADFADLFQRQFARQNDPAQSLLLPELDARPIHRVGLHRKMNRHQRKMPAHQHDQAGVGHDQRIRGHLDHRRQILEKRLQLGVVRGDVDHHIEALALRLRLTDAQRQVGVVEFVVAHPQAVARLAGVDRIGAISEGVTHVFQGAGGGEKLGGDESLHLGVGRKSRAG